MRFTSATVLILAAALCASQSVERNQTVLLKEVRFSGDLGLSSAELRQYTEFLTGHRLERAKDSGGCSIRRGRSSSSPRLLESAGDNATAVAAIVGIKGCGGGAGAHCQSWKAIPCERPDLRGTLGETRAA